MTSQRAVYESYRFPEGPLSVESWIASYFMYISMQLFHQYHQFGPLEFTMVAKALGMAVLVIMNLMRDRR